MAISLSERVGKFKSASQFIEQPPAKGAGIIIVDSTGENILVVREHKPKDATNREIGQLSIPLETAKLRRFGIGQERISHTILGAFTEIADDMTLPYLKHSLREVDIEGPHKVTLSPTISAHLAIYVDSHSLSQEVWSPTHEQETAIPHWMNLNEFLRTDNIRPFAQTAVTFAIEQGYLHPQSLQRTRRKSILSEVHSLNRFSQRRERRRDVNLT